jgi:hypothetical protein
MERRSLVNGGLVAGVAALVAPHRADAARADAARADAARADAAAGGGDDGTTNAVHRLQNSVEHMFQTAANAPWSALERIRKHQHDWLKSQQKYPDFIEVGLAVWDGLHDWHVRYQHPMSITRLDDGRYAMAFMFTTVLLRPDMQTDWIGYPFDLERRAPAAQ